MRRAALALTLAVVSVARPSAADSLIPGPLPPGSSVEGGATSRYWSRFDSQPFLAATLELGWAYVHPKFNAGVGKPFYRWIGVDAQPLVSGSGAGLYGGAHAQVPLLDLRAGARYFSPFDRKMLSQSPRHTRDELEGLDGPDANALTLEGELRGAVSLPGGGPFWMLTGHYVSGVDEDHDLYEESLKVVIRPPWVWRARVGYAFFFGRDDAIRLGIAEEVLQSPGRDGYVLRAGITSTMKLADTVDLQATLMPVIHSPDAIGLAGADFGQLGVRWRWATRPPKSE